MYIKAADHFITAPFDDPQSFQGELKKLTAFRLRRTNKFIMLSLLGAHSCVKGAALPDDLPLYFATENGNLYDTEIVLGQIYRAHSFPKPINFINTMSNVAAFYIAQSMGTTGRNLMVSGRHLSFERALELARSEMLCGTARHALVGAVDEAVFSREVFERKFGGAAAGIDLVEASGWMLVSSEPDGALAEIDALRSFADADSALQWLSGRHDLAGARVSFGMLVGDDERARWKSAFPCDGEYDYIRALGYNDSITPCGLISFIKKNPGEALVHVNRDARGRHVVISLRAF